MKDYKNISVRTMALDLSANNVGFCIGSTYIDDNNNVVFNEEFMFQERTKISYSNTGYNNYDLGLTAENIFRLARQVMKEFNIEMIVSEMPVGRRVYNEYKNLTKEIIDSEVPNDTLEDYFYTNVIKNKDRGKSMEEKGSFAKSIMHQDWSSTTLGLSISIIYMLSMFTPSRHPITVHPFDVKEATGDKNYRGLKKEDMAFYASQDYSHMNYIRDNEGKIVIEYNEHAIDALYTGKSLQINRDNMRNRASIAIKNTINKTPSKFKQLNGRFEEIKWSNLDDILKKYNVR